MCVFLCSYHPGVFLFWFIFLLVLCNWLALSALYSGFVEGWFDQYSFIQYVFAGSFIINRLGCVISLRFSYVFIWHNYCRPGASFIFSCTKISESSSNVTDEWHREK